MGPVGELSVGLEPHTCLTLNLKTGTASQEWGRDCCGRRHKEAKVQEELKRERLATIASLVFLQASLIRFISQIKGNMFK